MKLEELPENQLATRIKALQSDARELKNRQFASGSYNLVQYLNSTPATWDYNMDIGTLGDPVFKTHEIGIALQADNQKFAFGTPFIDMFVDGTAESNRVNDRKPLYQGANGELYVTEWLNWIDDYFGNDTGFFAWYCRFMVSGRVHVYIKNYVRSTDTGTVLKDYRQIT